MGSYRGRFKQLSSGTLPRRSDQFLAGARCVTAARAAGASLALSRVCNCPANLPPTVGVCSDTPGAVLDGADEDHPALVAGHYRCGLAEDGGCDSRMIKHK